MAGHGLQAVGGRIAVELLAGVMPARITPTAGTAQARVAACAEPPSINQMQGSMHCACTARYHPVRTAHPPPCARAKVLQASAVGSV